MAFLTKDRNTPRWDRDDIEEHPMKGGTTIFVGALVCLDAQRLAIPGRSAAGLLAIGRAEDRETSIVNGDRYMRIRRGVFQYVNSGGADLITRAAIGAKAFVVDDQTVALTDASGTRSVAGVIRDVDARGVWVAF